MRLKVEVKRERVADARVDDRACIVSYRNDIAKICSCTADVPGGRVPVLSVSSCFPAKKRIECRLAHTTNVICA
jgi:hypothetical protein